jgi:hypothetical protein
MMATIQPASVDGEGDHPECEGGLGRDIWYPEDGPQGMNNQRNLLRKNRGWRKIVEGDRKFSG